MVKEEYLLQLGITNRQNVERFIRSIAGLASEMPAGVRLGVLAVGSTTETVRRHDPEDIDLRVLNSTKPSTRDRYLAVEQISDGVRRNLNNAGADFTEFTSTSSKAMVKSTTGEEVSFVEYNNDDPSFEVMQQESLPLHISISGQDRLDLDSHLEKERRHHTNAVVLFTN